MSLFKRKPRLLLLADNVRYLKQNCYQSQLLITLKQYYSVKIMSATQIARSSAVKPEKYHRILSVLKLRSLHHLVPALVRVIGDLPLYLYEQDPWENFRDDAAYKGTYEAISRELNVVSFLNTSLWWSNFINDKGLKSSFVRMGMLPAFCSLDKSWEERPIGLGFQGSLHPHRKEFFDYLASKNHPVTFMSSVPYKKFLQHLNDIQIYIHIENEPWIIDGVSVPRNALWIKDIEAASRGCFALRDHEDESAAYNIDEIPTIFTFKDKGEAPTLLDLISRMSLKEKNERMRESVHRIRERDDWQTIIQVMENSGLNA